MQHMSPEGVPLLAAITDSSGLRQSADINLQGGDLQQLQQQQLHWLAPEPPGPHQQLDAGHGIDSAVAGGNDGGDGGAAAASSGSCGMSVAPHLISCQSGDAMQERSISASLTPYLLQDQSHCFCILICQSDLLLQT